MRLPALTALALLGAAWPAAAAPAGAEPALTRPRLGHLVTVDRAWRLVDEVDGLELCLTVENQGDRTAYEAAAWIELLGGRGAEMQRMHLFRAALEPGTLRPGDSGLTCLATPPAARGIFIRLRARWPVEPAARSRSGSRPRAAPPPVRPRADGVPAAGAPGASRASAPAPAATPAPAP
jgi:hypothetical protein